MKRPVCEAFYYLLRTGWLMRRHGLSSLQSTLQQVHIPMARSGSWTARQLCEAMDIACVVYWKSVLCLQRSAATAMLLRCHGFAVDLVIGAQIVPFKSHAWVELNGIVINDKSYIREIYSELERY